MGNRHCCCMVRAYAIVRSLGKQGRLHAILARDCGGRVGCGAVAAVVDDGPAQSEYYRMGVSEMTRALTISQLLSDESGATIVEYALIIALLSLVCVAIATQLGQSTSGVLTHSKGYFEGGGH